VAVVRLLFIVTVQFGPWEIIRTAATCWEDKFHIWSSYNRRDNWQVERGWFWMGSSSAGDTWQNGKPSWWTCLLQTYFHWVLLKLMMFT